MLFKLRVIKSVHHLLKKREKDIKNDYKERKIKKRRLGTYKEGMSLLILESHTQLIFNYILHETLNKPLNINC